MSDYVYIAWMCAPSSSDDALIALCMQSTALNYILLIALCMQSTALNYILLSRRQHWMTVYLTL